MQNCFVSSCASRHMVQSGQCLARHAVPANLAQFCALFHGGCNPIDWLSQFIILNYLDNLYLLSFFTSNLKLFFYTDYFVFLSIFRVARLFF